MPDVTHLKARLAGVRPRLFLAGNRLRALRGSARNGRLSQCKDFLARTALAYRITRDPKYLDGTQHWTMNLTGWDPKGITSHSAPEPDGSEGNDEASMPMLERMSLAWDWIGSELSPEERLQVLAVMTERGNQVLGLLRQQDSLSHPFSNHEGCVLAFLGDIADAEILLDCVLRCLSYLLPSLGRR